MAPPAQVPAEVTTQRLLALPKVELHVHLEGTIGPARAAQLARRHGRDPQLALQLEAGGYPRRYTDFDHFLRTFLASSAQLRTPDDLAEIAADFAAGQAAQHVLYSEVTFTAMTHVAAGMPPHAMWSALRDGFSSVSGTEVALVIDVVRDAGPDGAVRTLRLVAEADAPIVGLGLSGHEGAVAEREFGVLRDAADDLGLGLVVHAGETGPAAGVRAAVDDLGADRIGHGLATLQDPALTRQLAHAGIPLEVCPSSNVALGLAPSLAQHPLPRLVDAGLTVVVGSDDPPFFDTTLTAELEHAQRLLGGGTARLADLQLAAARAAFVAPTQRARLVTAIERWRGTPAD